MSKIAIEQLINSNYVKYDRMVEIIKSAFVGSNANSLNIYIDLYSILKVLYNDNTIYNIDDYSTVTSCIINMCAHYRDFFKTRFGTYATIYIVHSTNTPYINKQFYPNYNSKVDFMINSKPKIKDMIDNNIALLETLCPYLPHIHFVKGTFETGVIIYDLICREECVSTNPHLIITKDTYNYQLAAKNNVTILRPKKSNGQDISYYINKNNLYNTFLKERKVVDINLLEICSPELITLLMTLSSVKERNITMLTNIRTAMKLINNAVSQYKIVNGYCSSPLLIWKGLDTSKLKIGDTTFDHRFKSIDIQFQHSIYINTPECRGLNIDNLYDPDNVRAINNEFFRSNPLDLNRL